MALPSGTFVQKGIYYGFTLSEMIAEFDAYKAAVKARNSSLAAASINGQSFQFADLQKQSAELEVRWCEIDQAMAQVNPGWNPSPPAADTTLAVLA